MKRYENVQFEFLSADTDHDAITGTVIVRDQEMVLEVKYPDEPPYLIKGRFQKDFWAGKHQLQGDDTQAEAKWTKLDDIYIGIWIERGIEYYFQFRLE